MDKKRNYKREYEIYQGKPEQIANRSQRNKARRILMKEGKVRVGDGMDVDHKRPISKGGTNTRSNLRVQTDNNNRSFRRTSKNKVK